MWNKNREPLTPEERKLLRRSFLWAVASIAVWPLTVAWLYVGPWLAKSLGIEQHVDILYHDELTAIPCFLAFAVCCGMSYARAAPVIKKRPICLVWIYGPAVLLPIAWLIMFVVMILTLSK